MEVVWDIRGIMPGAPGAPGGGMPKGGGGMPGRPGCVSFVFWLVSVSMEESYLGIRREAGKRPGASCWGLVGPLRRRRR
jgi:hypothetical protein